MALHLLFLFLLLRFLCVVIITSFFYSLSLFFSYSLLPSLLQLFPFSLSSLILLPFGAFPLFLSFHPSLLPLSWVFFFLSFFSHLLRVSVSSWLLAERSVLCVHFLSCYFRGFSNLSAFQTLFLSCKMLKYGHKYQTLVVILFLLVCQLVLAVSCPDNGIEMLLDLNSSSLY